MYILHWTNLDTFLLEFYSNRINTKVHLFSADLHATYIYFSVYIHHCKKYTLEKVSFFRDILLTFIWLMSFITCVGQKKAFFEAYRQNIHLTFSFSLLLLSQQMLSPIRIVRYSIWNYCCKDFGKVKMIALGLSILIIGQKKCYLFLWFRPHTPKLL